MLKTVLVQYDKYLIFLWKLWYIFFVKDSLMNKKKIETFLLDVHIL